MRDPIPEIHRLALMAIALTLGAAAALTPLVPPGHQASEVFGVFVAFVLSVGMFASARRIRVEGARGQLRTILIAGSLGGPSKACLIAVGLVMLARVSPDLRTFLGDEPVAAALLLGLAIAQIDPVSVTEALDWKARHPDRLQLSLRGQALIHSWSTIDDLASLVLSALLLPVFTGAGGEGANAVLIELALNLPFFAAVCLAWLLLRRRIPDRLTEAGSLLLMGGAVASGALLHTRLGVAAAGLLFRELSPRNEAIVQRTVWIAYGAVLVAIGTILGDASWAEISLGLTIGLLLALLAVLSHALVAVPLTRKLPWVERVSIMLSQQNGMTAAVLGITLDRFLPGALPVVAVAIIAINLLHLGTTTLFERLVEDKHRQSS